MTDNKIILNYLNMFVYPYVCVFIPYAPATYKKDS